MTLIDGIFIGILIAVATASSCLVLAEFFLRDTTLDHTRKMERAREHWRHLLEDDDRKNFLSIFGALSLAALFNFASPMPEASAQTASVCPAYPEFPDENCTGWAHTGVTLTNHSGSCTLATPNATYDSKRFNCEVILAANGIKITRSEINGQVFLNSPSRTGILLEDVKIDGQNVGGDAAGQCVGGNSGNNGGASASDFVIRRAEIVGCSQGVYGRGWTLEDSYIHGLYLQGQGHTEPVLAHTGDIVMRHNRLLANYRLDEGTSGGGMSAVIAIYTHSSFWGDVDDVLITQNWIGTADGGRGQAGYCVYGGDGGDGDSGNATNVRVFRNVWDRGSSNKCGWAGPVIWIAEGAGSCWSDNRYEDGATIGGGSSPVCQEPQELLPNAPENVSVQ